MESPPDFKMWLAWEHFYTEPLPTPQVAVRDGQVVDTNASAKSRGLSVGMRLQHVLPLVPQCQVIPFRPDSAKQKAWLNRVAHFSDVIEPYEHHTAAVDLTPHPDPLSVAEQLVSELSSQPWGSLKHGVGPSVWIAQLAALQESPYRYIENAAWELAEQPIENLLHVSTLIRSQLRDLGMQTIGQVSKVSPALLRSQFGDESLDIILATQAKSVDRVQPLFPPDQVGDSIHFPLAINDSLSMHSAVHELARRLSARIQGKQVGVFIVTVETEEGGKQTLTRLCKRPIYTLQSIIVILLQVTDELQRSCQNIVRLTARLDRLESLRRTQQVLFSASSRTESDDAVNLLRTSIGAHSITLASRMALSRRKQVLRAWQDATGWV